MNSDIFILLGAILVAQVIYHGHFMRQEAKKSHEQMERLILRLDQLIEQRRK